MSALANGLRWLAGLCTHAAAALDAPAVEPQAPGPADARDPEHYLEHVRHRLLSRHY